MPANFLSVPGVKILLSHLTLVNKISCVDTGTESRKPVTDVQEFHIPIKDALLNVLKFLRLVACQKDLDKSGRPRSN